MKSLVPWSLFDDDLFPRFEDASLKFPRLDVEDKGDHLLVTADVPGIAQNDLNIEAEIDRLIIEGKTNLEKEEKNKNFYRKERRSGSFYRELPLPCSIDTNKVAAKFKNGTVEITLPKLEVAKEKRVKVNVK